MFYVDSATSLHGCELIHVCLFDYLITGKNKTAEQTGSGN